MNVIAMLGQSWQRRVNAHKTTNVMWFPPQYFDGLLGQGKTQVVIFEAQYQHEEVALELWMIQCLMILTKANKNQYPGTVEQSAIRACMHG